MPAMGPRMMPVPVGNPNSNPADPSGKPVRARTTKKANKPEPLLDDYKFWGENIPVSFGRRKVKGTIVWASKIRKVKARRFVDVAVALGYNLAPAGTRKGTTLGAFWFDGKKVFSLTKSATDITYKKDVFTTKTSSRPKGKATNINMQWRLYEGNDQQLPDVLIKNNKGASAVGFKNMIYLVITNLDFDRYHLTDVPEIEALLIDRFDNSKLFYERSSKTDHDGVDGSLTCWDSGKNTLHAININGTTLQSFNFNRMREKAKVQLTGAYTPDELVQPFLRVIYNSMSVDPETGLIALGIGHSFIQGLGGVNIIDPKQGKIMPGGAATFPADGSSATTHIWTEFIHAGKGAKDGLFLAAMIRYRYSNNTQLTIWRVNADKSLTFVWAKIFTTTLFSGEDRGALFPSGEERADGWGVLYFGHGATLHKIRVHTSATVGNAQGMVNIEDGPQTSLVPGEYISGGLWVDTTNRVLVRTIRDSINSMEFKQYDCPIDATSVPHAAMLKNLTSNPDVPHPRYFSAAETSRNTLGLGLHWVTTPSNRYFRILNIAQGPLTFTDTVPGTAIHVADDLERNRNLSLDNTQYWDSRKNGYVAASLGNSLIEPCPGPGFLWPNMSILADKDGVPLGQVIQWMLNYVGIPDSKIDIAGIPTANDHYRVLGGVFEDGQDVWEELRNICDIYNLVLTESDELIKVKYRDRSNHVPVQADLTDDDIVIGDGTLTDGLHYMDSRDIPRRVELSYSDPAVGYTVNTQNTERFPAPPIVIDSSEATQVNLPFVIRRKTAKFLSSTFLFSLWEGAASINISVGRKYLWLEVGDAISVNLRQASGPNLQMILEIQDNNRNPNCTMDLVCTEIEDQNAHEFGFLEEDADYTEEDADSDQDAEPLIFDVPTPEQYSAALPELLGASVPSEDGGWLGGNLYRTIAETNTLQGYTSPDLQPLHLVLAKDLPKQQHSAILGGAENSITVEHLAGNIAMLKSVTLNKLLADGNLCLIGSDTAGWEYISFQTMAVNSGDTFSLTDVIRGRRGTEYLTQAWPIGTDLYLFSPQTFLRIAPAVTAINTTLSFASSGIGQEVSEGESLDLLLVGHARKPFAPTHPRVTVGTWGSNLTIAFAPRVRGAYNWPGNEALSQFPYDETVLSFEIEVLNTAGTILRTIAASTPQFIYTIAQQNADFASNPKELKMRIYQLSPFGRGYSNLSVVET